MDLFFWFLTEALFSLTIFFSELNQHGMTLLKKRVKAEWALLESQEGHKGQIAVEWSAVTSMESRLFWPMWDTSGIK